MSCSEIDRRERERLDKEEENIVEYVKELLLDNDRIHKFLIAQIKFYWADSYGINMDGPMTDLQEEFVCQCQVQLMQTLLAKVMVA